MTGLDALFAPRGIGVVGASRDPGRIGATTARSLARFGGRLALVDPGLAEIEINPLRVTAAGPVALDAVVVPREASDAQPRQ